MAPIKKAQKTGILQKINENEATRSAEKLPPESKKTDGASKVDQKTEFTMQDSAKKSMPKTPN